MKILPDIIENHIIRYCPVSDKKALAMVCHRWFDVLSLIRGRCLDIDYTRPHMIPHPQYSFHKVKNEQEEGGQGYQYNLFLDICEDALGPQEYLVALKKLNPTINNFKDLLYRIKEIELINERMNKDWVSTVCANAHQIEKISIHNQEITPDHLEALSLLKQLKSIYGSFVIRGDSIFCTKEFLKQHINGDTVESLELSFSNYEGIEKIVVDEYLSIIYNGLVNNNSTSESKTTTSIKEIKIKFDRLKVNVGERVEEFIIKHMLKFITIESLERLRIHNASSFIDTNKIIKQVYQKYPSRLCKLKSILDHSGHIGIEIDDGEILSIIPNLQWDVLKLNIRPHVTYGSYSIIRRNQRLETNNNNININNINNNEWRFNEKLNTLIIEFGVMKRYDLGEIDALYEYEMKYWDLIVSSLTSGLNHLTRIQITFVYNIELFDQGINDIVGNCKNLVTLELGNSSTLKWEHGFLPLFQGNLIDHPSLCILSYNYRCSDSDWKIIEESLVKSKLYRITRCKSRPFNDRFQGYRSDYLLSKYKLECNQEGDYEFLEILDFKI